MNKWRLLPAFQELTLVDFFVNFRKYADAKTAYSFAQKMYAKYLCASNEEKAFYSVKNDAVFFDNFSYSGKMDFDRNGQHDSGYRKLELGWDGDAFCIRWCWYPE